MSTQFTFTSRKLTDQERIDYFANECMRLQKSLAHYKGRVTPKSTPAQLEKYRKYRSSEKGQQRMLRYSTSPAKQAADERYRSTINYFQR